ncbi:MAG: radical SAM protein [Elusimicrobia bacterium]|nr:radical SAM protein [Elusimicrobiota bacterium]
MKIVLVQPPALVAVDSYSAITQPPLGVAYLTAYARQRGHEVAVVDAVGAAVDRLRPWPHRAKRLLQGLDRGEIAARIPPDVQVIGVSCMFTHAWPMVRELLRALGEAFPKARLIAGGEHVTALPEKVLEESPVLACALGEGEATLAELLDAFAEGRDLAGVAGIAYRDAEGRIRRTPRRKRIMDVDSLPRPAWDLLDPLRYEAGAVFMGPKSGRSMPMLATRGCPYRCAFCASPLMWTQLWRPRRPELVIDEMQDYHRLYGATDFQFQDLTAVVRKDWIVAFCRELARRGLRFSWSLPVGTRAEAFDREVAQLLLAAGCDHVTFAPESASPRVLAAVEKKADLAQVERAALDCLAAGLRVCLFMIVGFPQESAEDLRLTRRWLRRMARLGVHEVAVSTFVPLPGTRLFAELGRVRPLTIDDEFCYGMTGATSLLTVRSWNPRLGDRALLWLKLRAMAEFFLISFLRRPWRLLRLLANARAGRQETKADRVVREFALKFRAVFSRAGRS